MLKKTLTTLLGATATILLVVGGFSPVVAALEPLPLVLPASISADVARKHAAHPYLLADKIKWDQIRANSLSDPAMAAMRSALLQKSDAILPKPVQAYEIPDGIRLLAAAREVKDRAYTLGAAWQITGDTKYAERLWKELENAANYKDWNPKHFLDTAELSNGVGIGYDWIHGYLTAAQREKIRNALITKGLQQADAAYAAGAPWTRSESNQNQVSNGGISVGALAVALENGPGADKTLAKAIPSASIGIQAWSPDGGYSEGTGYWAYAMQYTVTLMASLTSATGTDYGLSKTPGLSQAGLYPVYMQGPSRLKTAFNYGDEYPSVHHIVENLYLGKIYQNPVYSELGLHLVRGATADPKALIWYDASVPGQTLSQAQLPLDKYFRSSETVSFLSAWDQPRATYSAFKGRGVPSVGHSDLDLGSFVMSALDETWAIDLGRDEYTYAGNTTADRWEFYRKRAEGHNTLVFNPRAPAVGSTKADQNPSGIAKIQSFSSGISSSYAIADLSGADSALISWKRGMKQFDNKEQVLLQDEVRGHQSFSSAWWFMHTSANVEVSTDGRSAVLSKPNGKRLLARIVSSDPTLTFTSTEGRALPSSPTTMPQTENSGIRKLAISLAGRQNFTLAVQLTPLRVEGITPPLVSLQPLSAWAPSASVAASAQLKGIKVNGRALDGFAAQTLSYDVMTAYGSLPVITVDKSLPTDSVSITQVQRQTGKATVKVVSAGKAATTYNLWFENTDRVPKVTTASTASSAVDGPDKSVDSDSSTRWSAWGNHWIRYDFGSEQLLRNMDVLWGGNAARNIKYEIQTSVDGLTWRTVKDALYKAADTSERTVLNTSARYVRIAVHGDTLGGKDLHSSIREVRFYDDPEVSTFYNSFVSSVRFAVLSKDLLSGETFTNPVSAQRADGSSLPLSGTTSTFHSSDVSIATVDIAGKVIAKSEGTARISVTTWSSAGRTTSYDFFVINVEDPNTYILKPVADTWVNGGVNVGSTSGGTSKILYHKDSNVPGSGTDRKAFVQFQLPDLRGYEIVATRLDFNSYIDDGNGTATDIYVHPAQGTIDEATTTFTSRPTLSASIGKVFVSGPAATRTVDLSLHMSKLGNSLPKPITFGFSQISAYGLNTLIASRESGTPPVLTVTVRKIG